jgi:hypothetical protein
LRTSSVGNGEAETLGILAIVVSVSTNEEKWASI